MLMLQRVVCVCEVEGAVCASGWCLALSSLLCCVDENHCSDGWLAQYSTAGCTVCNRVS